MKATKEETNRELERACTSLLVGLSLKGMSRREYRIFTLLKSKGLLDTDEYGTITSDTSRWTK